jgi:class 3 adenylate cyclase
MTTETLERAFASTRQVLGNVKPDQLSDPSPCQSWTVREVINHVIGGTFVKSTGDGVLATFDGPARAVRCALALRDSLRDLGIEIRAGVHVGEIEPRPGDVAGLAVHIASRVCDYAPANQVCVTRTVRDLVAGSGLRMHDRGTQALKGVPEEWSLYAATA